MIPRKEISEETQKYSYYETEALTSIKQEHKNMGYRHTRYPIHHKHMVNLIPQRTVLL